MFYWPTEQDIFNSMTAADLAEFRAFLATASLEEAAERAARADDPDGHLKRPPAAPGTSP